MTCIFCGGKMINANSWTGVYIIDCYFIIWKKARRRRGLMGLISFYCRKKDISGSVGGSFVKEIRKSFPNNDLLNKGFKI